jgi:hypothetical protein
LHGGTDTTLKFAQFEISRYIVDGFDAHLLKFFDCVCMEPWYVANVVERLGVIAMIKELTDDWTCAMRPREDIGSPGHF